jgi:hypothetical protein
MNPGDWVAYVGDTAGIWIKGLCMRWNGVSWEAIEIKADGNFETNFYMAALMDLTEGAPNGTFMSILVRDLIVKTAMIEQIQAQLIQVQNAIFGGERFAKVQNADGTFSVVDQGDDKIGFKLSNGKLTASNADLSGNINAMGGMLNNITIGGNSSYYGKIDYGPFYMSIENPNIPTSTFTFERTEYARNVLLQLVYYFNGNYALVKQPYGFSVDGGSWEDRIGLIYLGFTHDGSNYTDGREWRMSMKFSNGNYISGLQYVGAHLEIIVGSAGGDIQTIKFRNLPSSKGEAGSGLLYKSANGALFVS